MSQVRQFVMAYSADFEKIKELAPEGFTLLRPVLRINVETIDNETNRVEFNIPVEHDNICGWLNMITWEDKKRKDYSEEAAIFISEETIEGERSAVRIDMSLSSDEYKENVLTMVFVLTGIEGGCPKEDDNQGTFILQNIEPLIFNEAETIEEKKEYADCEFIWNLPVREIKVAGEYKNNMIRQAMRIEPEKVLGAYAVAFERQI